jgi:hypothetical protein
MVTVASSGLHRGKLEWTHALLLGGRRNQEDDFTRSGTTAMNSSKSWKRMRSLVLVLGIGLGLAVTCQGQDSCLFTPTCLEDLDGLSSCDLAALYDRADVGQPLVGVARGKLVYLSDKTLPRLKLRFSAAVWRGKMGCEDGYFVNRWIGGVNRIDSHYVIGPSWVDGRPAVIMEYPPGTKLFWNMHDELREIAPGLYLGPVFERFPCPKFRGFVALQMEDCCKKKRCRQR